MPYAYFDGSFCCKTNEEETLDPSCDGLDFTRSSSCCQNDDSMPCPQKYGCEDYSTQGKDLLQDCPSS